jgi:hypothetical protein
MTFKSRLGKVARQVASAHAQPRPRLSLTSEASHQQRLDKLSSLCAKAFGLQHPTADAAYLCTLSQAELVQVYKTALQTLGDRSMEPGRMNWYRSLRLDERLGVLLEGTRDWTARESYRPLWQKYGAPA